MILTKKDQFIIAIQTGTIDIRCEAIWKQSKKEEILVKPLVNDEITLSTNYHQSLDMAMVMFDIYLVYAFA